MLRSGLLPIPTFALLVVLLGACSRPGIDSGVYLCSTDSDCAWGWRCIVVGGQGRCFNPAELDFGLLDHGPAQDLDQAVDRLVDQPVDQPLDQPVDQPVDQPFDQPLDQPSLVDKAFDTKPPPDIGMCTPDDPSTPLVYEDTCGTGYTCIKGYCSKADAYVPPCTADDPSTPLIDEDSCVVGYHCLNTVCFKNCVPDDPKTPLVYEDTCPVGYACGNSKCEPKPG